MRLSFLLCLFQALKEGNLLCFKTVLRKLKSPALEAGRAGLQSSYTLEKAEPGGLAWGLLTVARMQGARLTHRCSGFRQRGVLRGTPAVPTSLGGKSWPLSPGETCGPRR